MKQFLPALSAALLMSSAAHAQTSVTGPSTSTTPYQRTLVPNASITSLLTVGDSINGYKMVGIPDGSGAWDNGNGTFTLLMNHELGRDTGFVRAHGSRGAFVSKWIISKNTGNMQVLSGSDLTTRVYLYNAATNAYTAYSTGNPMPAPATNPSRGWDRFCSGDVPAISAFYNAATGKGTQERIMMNGEETGNEGRAFAHIATGLNAGYTYQLPHLGRFSWENSVARPHASDTTVVIGMDDQTPGQVYVYIGTKQSTGNDITRAGLFGGKLYGVAVTGVVTELAAAPPAANTPFTLVPIDTVEKMTGATMNTLSNTLGVTSFLRPEDGCWDPRNPGDFYFLTTNAINSPSRLWRLRFTNPSNPALGGTITAVLDGTEGQKMMDNFSINHQGIALIQEDVGGDARLGLTWQYDLATDSFKQFMTHDSTRFLTGGSNFITQDEEGSGIFDAQEILGAGYFLGVDQVHNAIGGEQVERGQLFLVYNPDSYNANPEISLTGNSQNIPNNSANPSTADNTDFGNISAGSTTTRTFTITNAGPAPLTITGINMTGVNGSEFSLVGAPTFPLTMAASGTQTLTVQFAPMAIGLRMATLNIASNDFDEGTYTVALRGVALNATGIAALAGGGAAKLYPNPTGDMASIDLSLKASERIQLSVLDLQGRTVVAATDRTYPAGDHKLSINTSSLTNGTYFVRLAAGNHTTRMKLIVAH